METLNSSWPCAGGMSDQCIGKKCVFKKQAQKQLLLDRILPRLINFSSRCRKRMAGFEFDTKATPNCNISNLFFSQNFRKASRLYFFFQIEAYQVNLPNNFWNTTENIFNQLKDVINSLLTKMSENEAEVENLNGEWFSEMEKAIEDLLM